MQTILYLLLSAALAVGQQPNKPPFSISTTAESPTVAAGADVWIKVRVTNTSNRDLDDSGGFSDRTGLDPNFRFDVRDDRGKPVPKRTYPHAELGVTGEPVNRTIAPGETLTQEQRVSALYDMRKPGKYVIRVSRRASDNPRDGEIKSNAVTVTVVP
jgi:hypothetical protein